MNIRETCMEYKKYLTNQGYPRKRVNGKMVLLHRLSYCEANKLALEDIHGYVVRHKCDNPCCINPQHLELGSQADNVRDMNVRGRQRTVHGIDSPHAKVTEEIVRSIRSEYRKSSRAFGYSALGRKYNISDVMVSHIANYRQWKHIV